jgi:hypothetical protein
MFNKKFLSWSNQLPVNTNEQIILLFIDIID